VLRDAEGRAFAGEYHPDAELAPRDVVARAVFSTLKERDEHNAFLDIRHRPAEWVRGRFPAIQRHLEEQGLDMATDLLPVTPAAHYSCGGVETDLRGRTDLPGLYAAGECARTGLHGGNRLASTSLLEALVFGAEIAEYIGSDEEREANSRALGLLRGPVAHAPPPDGDHSAIAEKLLRDVKKIMWEDVGLERTVTGTSYAADMLGDLRTRAEDLFRDSPTVECAMFRDAATSAEAVARAASKNLTSAGTHCIVDDRTEPEERQYVH